MKSKNNNLSNSSKEKALKTTAEVITTSAGILANVQIVKNNVKKIVGNFSDDVVNPDVVEEEYVMEDNYSDDITIDDTFADGSDFSIEIEEHEDCAADVFPDS